MTDHKERAHALLAPSAARRWMHCTPSMRLEQQFPDTTSDYAAEGTLAHEICEAKLRHHFYTKDFNRKAYNARMKELKAHELYQPEMDGYTSDYKDFVHKAALEFENTPYVAIEKRFDLSLLIPECFGTADCVLIGGGMMHVIDFKYGKGVAVSAENNEQLMIYALGAYQAFCMIYSIQTIKLSIVQPRIDNNNSCTITRDQLLTFGTVAAERGAAAYKGEGDYVPGDWCKFCKAKQQCRKRAEENVKLAFNVDKKPPLLTNDEIGEYLQIGRDVSSWLSDLQDYALAQCLAGNEVAGWKAVEGRSNRAWIDQEKAFDMIVKSGTPEELLYNRVPITLTKVEELLGKKTFNELLKDMVHKPPGKPTLVPASDKRVAITNKVTAAEAFKKL